MVQEECLLDERQGIGNGLVFRLPTEAEWEKAARGSDGRIYPWGNSLNKNCANLKASGIFDTIPVGHYSPQGDSPYGCADMAGNVWEWTHSLFQGYPYRADDGRETETEEEDDDDDFGQRVCRGSCLLDTRTDAHLACRFGSDPFFASGLQGFRLVIAPALG